MSLTDGKNILVYVETAQGAPVGPALEILAKAKELAAAKGEEVIAAILAEAPEEAAKTAVEAGADQAVIVKTAESRKIYTVTGAGSSYTGGQRCHSAACTEI